MNAFHDLKVLACIGLVAIVSFCVGYGINYDTMSEAQREAAILRHILETERQPAPRTLGSGVIEDAGIEKRNRF